MPGGVNAWRFRLAEEEEKRRRKFGWDDLFDLLSTAASGYSAVAGIGEARKRTALAEEQFGYRQEQDVLDTERQARLDKLAAEKHDVTMGDAGYYRADPAMQGPMPADTQTVGDWTKMPGFLEDVERRGATEGRQTLFDEYSANLPTGAELLPTGGGGYRGVYPPDYGQQGAVDTGPSEPDKDRFMQRAEDIADRYMMQQAHEGGENYLDPMANNAPNRGHPEWQQVYNNALQSFMGGGAEEPGGEADDLSTGAVLIEFAKGVAAQNPEALADLADADPQTATVVMFLSQNLGGIGGEQAVPSEPDYLQLGFESEPTPEMVTSAIGEAGQGLYRQIRPGEGVTWSDPEQKARQDALTILLRRLRREAYANRPAAPMQSPTAPFFDRFR